MRSRPFHNSKLILASSSWESSNGDIFQEHLYNLVFMWSVYIDFTCNNRVPEVDDKFYAPLSLLIHQLLKMWFIMQFTLQLSFYVNPKNSTTRDRISLPGC